MLQLVDAILTRAASNSLFNVKIPLLNTSIKDVISVASVFTDALFEFFVMVKPFDDRDTKSLLLTG